MRYKFRTTILFLTIILFNSCGLFNSEEGAEPNEESAFFWQNEAPLPVTVLRGFDKTEDEILYFYGDDYWFQSNDHGVSFQQFENPDSVYFSKVVKSEGTYYGLGHHSYYISQYDTDTTANDLFGSTSSIFISNDGNNWEQKMPAFLMWDFAFQDDSLLHMGREQGIRSYNLDFSSFRDRAFYSSKLFDYANEIFITNDGDIYLGCHDGIYKSDDKGLTWSRSSASFIHKDDDNVESFYETNEGQIFSIGTKVYSSSDNGSSWELYLIGFSAENEEFQHLFGSDTDFRKDELIYIASYFGVFIADRKTPENSKMALRYPEELHNWDRYNYVISFANGDIILINERLKKIMRGSKLESSKFWNDFE